MLNLYLKKYLLSPFVYMLLVLRSIIKYLIVVPILFVILFFKNAFVWVIIAVAAAFIVTPIGTAVVIVAAIFFTFSKTKEDVSDAIPMCLCGGWDYRQRISDEINRLNAEKKRAKYEKQILKLYSKVEDEFIGFDQIADVFVSFH